VRLTSINADGRKLQLHLLAVVGIALVFATCGDRIPDPRSRSYYACGSGTGLRAAPSRSKAVMLARVVSAMAVSASIVKKP
jgi:hypothetical protein